MNRGEVMVLISAWVVEGCVLGLPWPMGREWMVVRCVGEVGEVKMKMMSR